jgi:hypothetical protein
MEEVTTQDVAMDETGIDKFTPQISLPKELIGVGFWAEISSTDKVGITIDGVMEGDTIEISDISDECSFAKESNPLLAGFIGITAGILEDGISYYTKGRAKETNKALSNQSNKLKNSYSKKNRDKFRDGYGKVVNKSRYAKNEGGIIVCMPEAKGAIYANPDTFLKDGAADNGRKPIYFKQTIKNFNSFFPCRGKDGQMSAKALTDGTIHILAFDSTFEDNCGSYTVKFLITRKHDKFNHKDIKQKLFQVAPKD